MTAAQRTRTIIDFVLELSQDPDKAARYKADPTAYMTSYGLDADLQQEILQAQEAALATHTTRFDEDGDVGNNDNNGGSGSTVIVAVVVVVVA
ncbi:MAG: hypothetical protein JO144_10490 [Actinobacteria bacterium]|nr:hypothetical protein [Actinomycetota bacterium]